MFRFFFLCNKVFFYFCGFLYVLSFREFLGIFLYFLDFVILIKLFEFFGMVVGFIYLF